MPVIPTDRRAQANQISEGDERDATMKLTDLPDEVLNKILNYYLDSICFRDWSNRRVVDTELWRCFCAACELLLP